MDPCRRASHTTDTWFLRCAVRFGFAALSAPVHVRQATHRTRESHAPPRLGSPSDPSASCARSGYQKHPLHQSMPSWPLFPAARISTVQPSERIRRPATAPRARRAQPGAPNDCRRDQDVTLSSSGDSSQYLTRLDHRCIPLVLSLLSLLRCFWTSATIFETAARDHVRSRARFASVPGPGALCFRPFRPRPA